MPRKKTAAQLDREIAAALAQPKGRKAPSRPSRHRKSVADITERSPDAEFILEDEEFDLPWTEEKQPLAWFRFEGVGTLDDYARIPLDDDDLARMETIESWAQSRGSLAKALRESPILAFEDGTVLDGTHRLLVALRRGLKTVPVLIGHRQRSHA